MLSRNSFHLISKDSEDIVMTIAVFDHYDTRLYVWATFSLRQYRPIFIQIYMRAP